MNETAQEARELADNAIIISTTAQEISDMLYKCIAEIERLETMRKELRDKLQGLCDGALKARTSAKCELDDETAREMEIRFYTLDECMSLLGYIK